MVGVEHADCQRSRYCRDLLRLCAFNTVGLRRGRRLQKRKRAQPEFCEEHGWREDVDVRSVTARLSICDRRYKWKCTDHSRTVRDQLHAREWRVDQRWNSRI